MNTALKDFFAAVARARASPPPVWPTGAKLAQLVELAARFWFTWTENADGTRTIAGPTIATPITLDERTATIRLLNEVCSAMLAEDCTNLIYKLEQPLYAPFVAPRRFIQRRITVFRAAHRDYEAVFKALTQQKDEGDSNVHS
jgi:hypothetical protein